MNLYFLLPSVRTVNTYERTAQTSADRLFNKTVWYSGPSEPINSLLFKIRNQCSCIWEQYVRRTLWSAELYEKWKTEPSEPSPNPPVILQHWSFSELNARHTRHHFQPCVPSFLRSTGTCDPRCPDMCSMVTRELCSCPSTRMLLPFKRPLLPFRLIYTPVKLSLGWIPEYWAARLHNKHFTHAFLWSVFCVYPKRVCMCVSLWEDGRLKLDLRGARQIHEGPLSCPRPIRSQTWIVRLESSASLWQIFTRLLRNI